MLHVIDLAKDSTCLLGLELRNFDFAFPVLVLACLLDTVVLLDDEGERLWHVLLLLHQLFQLTLTLLNSFGGSLGDLNVCLLLLQTGKFRGPIFFELESRGFSISQVLLELSEHLGRGATAELKLNKLFVTFLDLLHVLLVRNLHLMEVNELEVLTHLVLLLDLGFGLQNGNLQRHVLLGQFLDLSLFL